MQNVNEKDLFDGYTAYTSAEELGLHDGQAAA
ncbi:LxmA leader domain family RiPP, partial [Streptomyces sp. NPDC090036]